MSKKIGEKIYFFLIFISVFVCNYVAIQNLHSHNIITCSDVNIDLTEEENLTDNSQKSIDQIDDTIIHNLSNFDFSSFSVCILCTPYSQNFYEICLGFNTPPPKGV